MTATCQPDGRFDRDASEWPDTLNREGARALARRLQDYWHARGYLSVCFWPEPVAERVTKIGTYEIYRVACNLVNGLPPPSRCVK